MWLAWSEAVVGGDIGEVGGSVGGGVEAAAIGAKAVAYDEPLHAHHQVIAAYLLENALRYRHRRGLVLNYGKRTGIPVVDHGVAPAARAVEGEAYLVGHEPFGIAAPLDEKIDKPLPHAFLGRERDMFLPEPVVYFFHIDAKVSKKSEFFAYLCHY